MEELHVISLGAGVQSTTMLLMAAHGEIEPKPKYAIFADTGWEPKRVYEHLEWLAEEAGRYGIEVIRVSNGNIRDDMHRAVEEGTRFASLPFFLPFFLGNGEIHNPRNEGKAWRQCTAEYKLVPVQREIRRLAGYKGTPRKKIATVWIGISWDEMMRAKPSKVKWLENRHPLLEKNMDRFNCMRWLQNKSYPIPPKSSCIGCPFHDNVMWLDMKRNYPEEWEEAVEFDRAVRHLPRFKKKPYLHRSCKPLDEVNLGEDQGELDLFINECEGYCGV
ncbi:hypothetical protein [Melghirimyces algeriensis]|uniref:3'-phosphoadenosine 5'-phosphosulfate sulfotransferase (PAPS reductase)/FAD synthetase n=1 Tax=Melghirimyces algeriensis TaxID=910412 RepID=A0A521C5A0_9BACL|nr:hypothetical protein [Melghirimyces algeriensis]SMO54604.1 hypothetical protein SAMN06264849_103136 [Melghirimyces algeriensis]